MAQVHVQFQNATKATMRNTFQRPMTLARSHNWHGVPECRFPPTIPSCGEAKFTHDKGGMLGSMAAVQYDLQLIGGVRSFILAWHAPAQLYPSTAPNRVFAIAGSKDKIDGMKWEEIEALLEKATDNIIIVPEIWANIKHDDVNHTAILEAIFGMLK